jgi:Uma2 family endonuclease
MMVLTGQEVIRNLLSFPNAPILIKEIETKLAEERKRRLDFYDTVTDEHKVEFINGEVIIHSPVKKEHNDANGSLLTLLSVYVQKNKLGYVGI